MDWTTKGRVLLTAVAALTTVGGFLADWNRTHLFNPDWSGVNCTLQRVAEGQSFCNPRTQHSAISFCTC
jgi:hypothetical protein